MRSTQLPEPQPGWAQQYDGDLQPIWARKFEPPAITGGESRGVLQLLMRLYRETGDPRWLAPIPSAVAYYRRSELPGGKLARFYELGSNQPLYFTRDYHLTYDDSSVPNHYAFTLSSWVENCSLRYVKDAQSPTAIIDCATFARNLIRLAAYVGTP